MHSPINYDAYSPSVNITVGTTCSKIMISQPYGSHTGKKAALLWIFAEPPCPSPLYLRTYLWNFFFQPYVKHAKVPQKVWIWFPPPLSLKMSKLKLIKCSSKSSSKTLDAGLTSHCKYHRELHAAKSMGLRTEKSWIPANILCNERTTLSKISGTTHSKIIIRHP